jgi:hypothetical protein
LSLERLSRLGDGRIAYRMKHPGPRGHTHRLMTPIEFLARLAALVPPPRFPLVRYHGTLAPHSKSRALVVPRAPSRAAAALRCPTEGGVDRDGANDAATACEPKECGAELANAGEGDTAALEASGGAHTDRVRRPIEDVRGIGIAVAGSGGERLDWATLLERVHRIDALACSRCNGGRLEFVAVISDRAVARKILEHVGGWRDPERGLRRVTPCAIDIDVPPPYD